MPKGPRKFHFSFEKQGLTRYGRLSLSGRVATGPRAGRRVTKVGDAIDDETRFLNRRFGMSLVRRPHEDSCSDPSAGRNPENPRLSRPAF